MPESRFTNVSHDWFILPDVTHVSDTYYVATYYLTKRETFVGR